jgi:hypothetical protein
MTGASHDVFISYSSKDKATADAVCALLEQEGIRCWIAPRDVLPGEAWPSSIIQAISTTKIFVLIFSSFSNASAQIKREVERAANREIPIIPFRIDDVTADQYLEYFISSPHWMDAFTPPLDQHIQQLSANLKRLLAKTATAPTPEEPLLAPSQPQQLQRRPARGMGWMGLVLIGLVCVVVIVAGAVIFRGGPSPSPGAPPGNTASPTPPVAATTQAPQTSETPQTAQVCHVADPTPSLLNVRVKPNGDVTQSLANGTLVRVVKRAEVGGKSWALIESENGGQPLGWVFDDYIYCGG